MDFSKELASFGEELPERSKKILEYYKSLTGLPLPKGYVVPPIEFSQEEKILLVGEKPNYSYILNQLAKQRQALESGNITDEYRYSFNDFLTRVEGFVALCSKHFPEAEFEDLDEQWLKLKRNLQLMSKEEQSFMLDVQKLMECFYGREYEFVVCGDYSYNKQKIWLYVKNIEQRVAKDEKYAVIPVQEALECMLAHELFHSLHFMSLEEACTAKNLTMLKLFGYGRLFNFGLYKPVQKRKTVIESLAKSFEVFYAKANGYEAYYSYESNNFKGKRKHYPAWSYAGAKGLIKADAAAELVDALKKSLDVTAGRGFLEAYTVIDGVNSADKML